MVFCFTLVTIKAMVPWLTLVKHRITAFLWNGNRKLHTWTWAKYTFIKGDSWQSFIFFNSWQFKHWQWLALTLEAWQLSRLNLNMTRLNRQPSGLDLIGLTDIGMTPVEWVLEGGGKAFDWRGESGHRALAYHPVPQGKRFGWWLTQGRVQGPNGAEWLLGSTLLQQGAQLVLPYGLEILQYRITLQSYLEWRFYKLIHNHITIMFRMEFLQVKAINYWRILSHSQWLGVL